MYFYLHLLYFGPSVDSHERNKEFLWPKVEELRETSITRKRGQIGSR